jgi:hypothetical protein
MSAFVVSEVHINSLLSWANLNRVYPIHSQEPGRPLTLDFSVTDDLSEMAQTLMDENTKAVNIRYHEHETPLDIFFVFVNARISPVQVLKACNCYDYQSCEDPAYEQTLAAQIIQHIRMAAIHKLPGYDAAAWELAELPKLPTR